MPQTARTLGVRRGVTTTGMIVVLIGAPLALFSLMLLIPHLDAFFMSAKFHVVVVSSIAVCVFFVAVVAWYTALRAKNASVLWVALGCLGMAILMVGHGLTTPGALGQPFNAWVGRFPVMGIALFAVGLVAASIGRHPLTGRIARVPQWMSALPIGALVVLAAVVVSDPLVGHGGGPVPFEDTFKRIVSVAAGLMLVSAGASSWRQWRFGRDRVQFALATAAWYSACALVSLQLGRPWHLSWWDYHAYLLAGFGAATWAVAKEAHRSGDPVAAMTRLTVRDPVEQISRGYTESLRPLVAAVEAKDFYTHGHSERVSTLAARLALRMRLSPESVRAVAEGAYLHDIGKIGIPDAVLNKDGPLDDGERQVIEGHPVTGWEIVGRAPSLRHTLAAVHYHHERWDGSGYPDGLVTADIPLVARLVAIADVWDALTSDRAYRPAWSHEQAAAYIDNERGRHFDPDCTDAILAFLADQHTHLHVPASVEGTVREVDVCHHRVGLVSSRFSRP